MEENKGVVLDELLDQGDLNLKVPYLTQVSTVGQTLQAFGSKRVSAHDAAGDLRDTTATAANLCRAQPTSVQRHSGRHAV
jgi:hypothetical protein